MYFVDISTIELLVKFILTSSMQIEISYKSSANHEISSLWTHCISFKSIYGQTPIAQLIIMPISCTVGAALKSGGCLKK